MLLLTHCFFLFALFVKDLCLGIDCYVVLSALTSLAIIFLGRECWLLFINFLPNIM